MQAHAPQPEKKQDTARVAQARGEIAQLRWQAQRGHIALAYLDETGFEAAPPNRRAWSVRGQQHRIQAHRGRRLNVMAALLADGALHHFAHHHALDGQLFVGFLGWLHQHVDKPLTVILDNASIHRARYIQPMLEILKKQGVTLYFLPSYSPELNRIEILWRHIKYQWLPPERRDPDELERDINHIVHGFGVTFHMSF